jgi:hypothetical protein
VHIQSLDFPMALRGSKSSADASARSIFKKIEHVKHAHLPRLAAEHSSSGKGKSIGAMGGGKRASALSSKTNYALSLGMLVVMLCAMLRHFRVMVLGLKVVAVSNVRMMMALSMMALLVRLGSLMIMLRCVLVMFCGFRVAMSR